jgi:hypothetical protein
MMATIFSTSSGVSSPALREWEAFSQITNRAGETKQRHRMPEGSDNEKKDEARKKAVSSDLDRTTTAMMAIATHTPSQRLRAV